MAVTKLYYAVGGGLGHLKRGRTIQFTLGWKKEEVLFLHSSPFESPLLKNIHQLCIPLELNRNPKAYKRWLIDFLQKHNFNEIYLDTFPVGIVGEWNGVLFNNVSFFYVARHLKWVAYQTFIKQPIHFEKTFIVDFLPMQQKIFIQNQSKKIVNLKLKIFKPPTFFSTYEQKFWLIAHSTPQKEVMNLIDLAILRKKETNSLAEIWVITQENIFHPAVKFFQHLSPIEVYHSAERIFTGCGFNCMLETLPYQDKHYFIPFKRRFDDQFLRAVHRLKKINRDYV